MAKIVGSREAGGTTHGGPYRSPTIGQKALEMVGALPGTVVGIIFFVVSYLLLSWLTGTWP